MTNIPPKRLLGFFRWFCRPEYRDDIEGDLYERYDQWVKTNGKLTAGINMTLEVIKLLRPNIIRPLLRRDTQVNLDLFRHNLISARRTLLRDTSYTLVNIIGMTTSIVAAIFVFKYVDYEKSYDTFHPDHQDLYRITTSYSREDEPERNLATSPPSLSTLIVADLPEVASISKLHQYGWDLTISHDETKFRESNVLFAEPTLFDQFGFELIQGNPKTCLSEVRMIVITEEMAKKYFGTENPMGRELTLDGAPDPYKITGIVQNPPANSHIQFDFLVSYETVDWWWEGEARLSWDPQEFYTYIQILPEADLQQLQAKINQLFALERGTYNDQVGLQQSFQLQSVSSIHLDPLLENELTGSTKTNRQTITILYTIGWFILIIAWVNYINLSTSKSIKRSVEVGIRKVIGGQRKQLVSQFILESFLINMAAISIALLVLFFIIDWFNALAQVTLSPTFFLKGQFWIDLLMLWMFGSLASGIYPAYTLSAHRPLALILKVDSRKGSSGYFRGGLVILQFAISMTLLSGAIIVYQQLTFMKKANLGFNPDQVMVIKGPNHISSESDSLITAKYQTLLQELKRQPGVKTVTSGATIPGEFLYDVVGAKQLDSNQSYISFNYTWVDYDYFATFQIPVLHGTSFEPTGSSKNQVMINETGVRKLGYQNPAEAIGKTIKLANTQRVILGVVEDFHQESLHHVVSPMVIDYSGPPTIHFALRYNGNPQALIKKAETIFETIYPRDPFDFFFLDRFYDRQYQAEERLSKVVIAFAAIAILIGCLGLLGLASYSLIQRTKEIGIRRVLGARFQSLIILLSKQFLRLLGWSLLLAIPICYWIMKEWLRNFSYQIKIDFTTFGLATCLILLTTVMAMGATMIKMANINPVDALRDE